MKIVCINGPLEGQTVEVRESAKNCPSMDRFTVVQQTPPLVSSKPAVPPGLKELQYTYYIMTTNLYYDETGQWIEVLFATVGQDPTQRVPHQHIFNFMLGQAPASNIVVY